MENATKALLIAAAVLIVIVLIALGVRLLNSSKDTSDQIESTSKALSSKTSDLKDSTTSSLQTLSMDEIEKFNHQFEQYFGDGVSAEQCKKIIEKVKKNNNNTNKHNMIYLVFRYETERLDNPYDEPRYSAHGSVSSNNNLYTQMIDKLNEDTYKNKKYKIGMTGDCGTYKKGYTNDGYIGCITIWAQE